MKKYLLIILIALSLLPIQGCTTVGKPNQTRQPTASEAVRLIPSDSAVSIGISAENYPLIDGSTSTLPLVQQIFMHMFLPDSEGEHEMQGLKWHGLPQEASKTVPSYEMLINGEVDLIIVPDPSADIIKLSGDAGVELEYIPIGAEALVFITHLSNPADNITSEQVRKIYSDMTITNWSELGGGDGRIIPICRNSDSGSQAQMDNIVMKEKAINPAIAENYMERDMNGMLQMVEEYLYFAQDGEESAFTLGYTMYYYINVYESIQGETFLKTLAYDGVKPTPETLLSKEYPLATNYYAVIRKDTPTDHSARKIADWLISYEGQWAVVISGLGSLSPLYEKQSPTQ